MGKTNQFIWPSQETVNEVWDFLVFAREKLVQKTRLERIQKWRTRMKASALSNCSDILHICGASIPNLAI